MTQDLAKASRDRENIRSELFQALETVKRQNSEPERRLGVGEGWTQRRVFKASLSTRCTLVSLEPNTIQWSVSITIYLSDPPHQTGSCEQCPPSWLPFQGSCYYFSETQAIWDTAQSYCGGQGAHLVIVRGLNEQVLS